MDRDEAAALERCTDPRDLIEKTLRAIGVAGTYYWGQSSQKCLSLVLLRHFLFCLGGSGYSGRQELHIMTVVQRKP